MTKKFLNEFNTNLYISRDKHRGYTTINRIQSQTQNTHVFNRLANQTDIIKVDLDKALLPGDSITLEIDYQLKILKEKNFQVSVHYAKPIPLMKYYLNKYTGKKDLYSNAIEYAKTNISLPCYPKLKLKEVDKISETIIKYSH